MDPYRQATSYSVEEGSFDPASFAQELCLLEIDQFDPQPEIDEHESCTPGAIASALRFSQATITSIVDRLEDLGFVQRRRSEKAKRQFILLPLCPRHSSQLIPSSS